jgi:type IV secretion system protein VirD4
MVSRQETARPLLTPGEVMQLPSDEAIVQVSGMPPIRAKKARYYVDRELAARVAPPPGKPSILLPTEAADWVLTAAAPGAAGPDRNEDVDEGGLRIEPELGSLAENIAGEPDEPVLDLEPDDDGGVQAEQSRRFRAAARIAALDPDDGIPL